MDRTVVDEWVRVSDRDSFLTARRLAREEGLLVGGSGGTTVWAALEIAKRFGPEATILSMIPDSGRSYMSKFYDDNWMLEHGFAERRVPAPTVSELLRSKRIEEIEVPALITIAAHQKVGEAIDVMQQYSISQLPVVRDGDVQSLADVIGSLQDRDLLDRVFKNPDALHEDVATAMQPPLAAVETDVTLDEVFATLTGTDERRCHRQQRQADRRADALRPPRLSWRTSVASIGSMSTQPLQVLLEQAFPDATELSVEDRTGGGDHFQVTVASPRFAGLALLDQHRLVNEALAEPLRDGTIHELRIKTKGSE